MVHVDTGNEIEKKIPLMFLNKEGTKICLNIGIRPHARKLLNDLNKYYEVIVFTAASREYANAVIRLLDPKNEIITSIMSRENCFETKNGFLIKDLRVFSNRDLKNIIIVDNLAHSFGLQINNGIPIISWTGDSEDKELLNLSDYLIAAAFVDDVRKFNRSKLNLEQLVEEDISTLDVL